MSCFFKQKGNRYEKNTYACFYGASLSTMAYHFLSTYAAGLNIQNIGVENPESTYAAAELNIQNIGVENPDDDILQAGVFEQTLSNFIAVLTFEDVQTLHNFLADILKRPDREAIFTDFQADMQEKGLEHYG